MLRDPRFLTVIAAFGVFLLLLAGMGSAVAGASGAAQDALSERLTIRADGREFSVRVARVDCLIRPGAGVTITNAPQPVASGEIESRWSRAGGGYTTSVIGEHFHFQSSERFVLDGNSVRYAALPGTVTIVDAQNGNARDGAGTLSGTIPCHRPEPSGR